VGNNDYAHATDLARPIADAAAIQRRLTEAGYRSTEIHNVTLAQINTALDTFTASVSPEDSLFFYFAGHGLQYAHEGYLWPVDARITEPAHLADRTLAVEDLLSRLAERPAKQVNIILDACRNMPFGGVPEASPGLASISARSGFFIAFSAGVGEFALDNLGPGDNHQNSVFTRALLDNLRPNLSVSQAVLQSRPRVLSLARSVGLQQTPTVLDQRTNLLRLDSRLEDVGGRSIPGSGMMDETTALVVSMDGVKDGGDTLHFPGTERDGRYVSAALERLGVATTRLINPTRVALIQAVEDLARAPTRRILHLATPGIFNGDEAYPLVRPTVSERYPTLHLPESAVPLGNLLRRLGRDGKTTLVLLDSGLPHRTIPGLEESAALSELANGVWTLGSDVPHRVFVISSCNFFQGAADAAANLVISPFALAVENALARPGQTCGAVADLIRSQVEDMTDGTQTPIAYGSRAVRDETLVHWLS
jgi:hypothetical protein